MKSILLGLGFLLVAQPTQAAISQMTFAGTGIVGVSTGPLAPALNASNTFSGKIVPFAFPLANNASGNFVVNDAITYWEADDTYMFMVDNFAAQSPVGSFGLTNGFLTSFNLSGGDGQSGYLNVFTTGFQGWLFDPTDQTQDSYYSGSWNFVSTASYQVGPNGDTTIERIVLFDNRVPEPASWAMMIAGFALVGMSLRAKYRTKAQPL